jgi:hypothetical protein
VSEHFICDEMLDVGEKAERLAEEENMPRRERAKYVFLMMREVEDLALMRGKSEAIH